MLEHLAVCKELSSAAVQLSELQIDSMLRDFVLLFYSLVPVGGPL